MPCSMGRRSNQGFGASCVRTWRHAPATIRTRAQRSRRYDRVVQEPWSAVISGLSSAGPAPIMECPRSQRRVVRCPDEADGAESGGISALSRAMRLRGRVEPRAASDARLIEALRRAPATLAQLAAALSCTRRALSNRLTRLRHERRVRRAGIGQWAAM